MNKKNITYIAGALIIGALGSGLWSVAFQPFFSAVGRFILVTFSFGLEIAQVDIYREVATRSKSAPVILVLNVISITVFWFLGTQFPRKEKLDHEITDEVEGETSKLSLKEQKEYLEASKRTLEKNRASLFKFQLVFFSWFSLLASSFFYQYIKFSHVASAISHYEQSIAIIRPFIEGSSYIEFESQFARIASPADYITLLDELEAISKQHDLDLPAFKPLGANKSR